MNKIFTFFAFFCFAMSFAQHKVADRVAEYKTLNAEFKHFSVLTATGQPADSNVLRAVTKSTLAQINNTSVNNIVTNQYETLELEIPYQATTIMVELYKAKLFNENFHADTDKQRNIAYDRGVHYRGIVKGDSNSVVSFNFFNGELNAIISASGLNNLVIGRLDKANNTNDYIIYSDADMRVPNGFNCAVKENSSVSGSHPQSASREIDTEHCVTMYLEIDYDIYMENGSSTTQTNNWATSVFNNVQTLYANDGITVSLKSTFVWTDEDPYVALSESDSSSDYLYMFNAVRPVFDGDVGQLLGIDPGGLGGVAVTIDGLCSQYNFSYSDVFIQYSTVPTWSWTVQVITHEFGHLLGSRHTHACVWNGNDTSIDGCGTQAGYVEGDCAIGPIPVVAKGTIMSYCHLISGVGISFNNGFGPQPTAAIVDAVESAQCLSSDCVNTCINMVVDISVVFPANNTAAISWNDLSGATSWQVSVSLLGSSVENWITVNTNSYTTPAVLNFNTFYKVHIRPLCDGISPMYREGMFATPAIWCNGVTITDTGGVNNDYTDNQYYIRTLIPTQPQKKIKLVFNAFDLEADYDFLSIYDGPNVDSPSLGDYTGDFVLTPIESSAPDGSLTIKFFSDSGVVESGYIATVSCTQHLGVDNFGDDIDFSYSPNPTTGSVSIVSNSEMDDIAVYNVQGQLLYHSKNNGLDKYVDLSSFAGGTYFFKLNFGDRQVNFKIVKN